MIFAAIDIGSNAVRLLINHWSRRSIGRRRIAARVSTVVARGHAA